MKILFINTSPFLSGAEKSMIALLESLNYHTFEVIVILPKINNYQHLIPKRIKCINMSFIWFINSFNPIYLINCIISIIIVTIKLTQIIKKEEIKIIYSNTAKASINTYILKFFNKNCKFICHIRDNIHYKPFIWILNNRCDIIICVSQYIRDQFKGFDFKCHHIYGGIDIDNCNIHVPISLKTQLDLSENSILIAQIGQLSRWKNQIDFINAALIIRNHYPMIHFIIIGDNFSKDEIKYKKELVFLIDILKMNSYVSFLGFRKDINELISQIDILVHPAINEPFGRVLIEAMAFEKPVVAYRCGGPEEIIVDSQTGFLVEPYDVNNLAKKTIQLIEDKELRIQFGKEGRKKVVENFNLGRYTKEMKEIFESFLGSIPA